MNLPGFVELKVLGKGTYGCVYKARRISDGQVYAVKVVNLGNLNHREIEDSINEIRLMASFQSPFIIRFYEAFCDNKRLCIVTEYSRLGDLSHLIERRKKKGRPLKEDVIWRYLLQMLDGLKVLHSCGVVHRDLKSANILLSGPDLIKIADLGVSTVLRTTQLARTQIGTPLYLAPEVWKRRPYNQRCDMWSLGILLYEMMTFSYPFMARTSQELVQRVCLGRFTPPRGYSSELVSIVRRLLQVNPLLRPTVDELLELQCVSNKRHLLSTYIDQDSDSPVVEDKLLSTIKVPHNIKNVHLPRAAYGKEAHIVKPIEQRMHMKRGVPLARDLQIISSPELQMITDLDWWSPNKAGREDNDENISENKQPLTYRPAIIPVQPPCKPPPRRKGISPREIPNPRFRRIAIR